MKTNTNFELMIKEFDILQDVIKFQEDIRMKSRNWCITIISAITITFISEKISFSNLNFLIMNSVLIVLFLWLELIYRVAEKRAIIRSSYVESALRGEKKYDGPLIGKSLSKSNSIKTQIKELNNIRIYFTYLILFLLTILIYLIK